jgi:hypothetical protein
MDAKESIGHQGELEKKGLSTLPSPFSFLLSLAPLYFFCGASFISRGSSIPQRLAPR